MQNKKYQIFISSTFEDLQNERRDALEAILITKNIPIGMEAFVASSQKQFEYIKECINSCDYYILLVGGRYGTIHPEFNISYTELEFDYAKSLNKPILIFYYKDISKLRKKDENLENINKFRDKIQKEILCQPFKNKRDLKGLILTALNQEIERNPQTGWIRCNQFFSKYKTQKDCIISLQEEGRALYSFAAEHMQKAQLQGIYAPPFPADYEFQVWEQKIIEFIKHNNLDQSYFYQYPQNTPYVQIIKNQMILLEGLLASYDYKEIATK